jgi:hypothetical protein
MFRLAESIRDRRRAARNRVALERAISNAASPAMRDELIIAAQRQVQLTR